MTYLFLNYQLAFLTPGISPRQANSRKQIRHRLKRRRYPLERPQILQRKYFLVENFGVLFDLFTKPFLAMILP